jgi:hypothetical protein
MKPQDKIHQGRGGGEDLPNPKPRDGSFAKPEAEWIFGAKPEALNNATINWHIFVLIKISKQTRKSITMITQFEVSLSATLLTPEQISGVVPNCCCFYFVLLMRLLFSDGVV